MALLSWTTRPSKLRAADDEPSALGKFGVTSIPDISLAHFLYAGSLTPFVELSPVIEHQFTVEQSETQRLDVYLAARLPDISRSHVRRLIEDGHVTVNAARQKPSYNLLSGDTIVVRIPPPEPSVIAPEEIPLDIPYEDEQIIVINKPKGMTVHPAPGSKQGTLVNAILAHSDDLSGIGGVERPGIVHRLDKDTSGLLVVAKTDAAHAALQKQMQKRSVGRKYLALVWGATRFNQAVVDAPIGRHPQDRQKMAVIKDTSRYRAREAVTNLEVRERFGHFTLLEAKLETGRTHQIRVHCSYIGHPVVGDPTYGGLKRAIPSAMGKLRQRDLACLIESLHGQALHAYSLSFEHPATGRWMTLESPMPAEMNTLIDWLRRDDPP